MNITINSVHFNADKKLEDFIESKLSKLNKLYSDILAAEVFLRLERNHDMENKIAEIKLDIPGNGMFVKKQSKSFEESTDTAIDALRKQLQRRKAKTQ